MKFYTNQLYRLLLSLLCSFGAIGAYGQGFTETFGTASSSNSNTVNNSPDPSARLKKVKTGYSGTLDPGSTLNFYSGGSTTGPAYSETGSGGKGAFSISTNSKGHKRSIFYKGGDHTNPSSDKSFMLLVDGHTDPNTIYYDRDLSNIKKGRPYKLSAWIKNVNNEVNANRPLPLVQLCIYDESKYKASDPSAGLIASMVGGPPANTKTSGQPKWHELELLLVSAPEGVSTFKIQIRNAVTNAGGNDFALDDIEMSDIKLEANDDFYEFFSNEGGKTLTSVLGNDIVYPSTQRILLTLLSNPSSKIKMDSKGFITVDPNLTPGQYKLKYKICSKEKGCENECDDAEVIIKIHKCMGNTLLVGTVMDSRTTPNTPLKGIPLSLIPQDPVGDRDTLRIVTNSKGQYRFENIPEGPYLLQVQDHHLIMREEIYPTESSLFWTRIQKCKMVTHHFYYQSSPRPVIGDFVWLDVNADGLQNEWYDANGDGKITKNQIDIENFQNIDYKDWEWIDNNGNGTWNKPEDEGELNKAGLGSAAFANIQVTGPNGYLENIIVGVDGYWRDRPGTEEDPLFGHFVATLIRDATLDAVTVSLASTGKVKTFDAAGNAVAPSGARRALDMSSARSARTAAVLEVYAANGLTAQGGVTVEEPQNLTLDIGLSTRDAPMPVSWVDFSARWEKESGSADLQWSTAAEFDNKGFEIEHSRNSSQWTKIGFVGAKERTAGEVIQYRFKHADAAAGINYYRLKQLDVRGSFDYSVVRSLDVPSFLLLSVYPNPASDLLHLSESVTTKGVKSVHLVDLAGRIVRAFDGKEPKLNLTGLGTGMYQVKITFLDGTTENIKLLKR
jgi:hypothetical protein